MKYATNYRLTFDDEGNIWIITSVANWDKTFSIKYSDIEMLQTRWQIQQILKDL